MMIEWDTSFIPKKEFSWAPVKARTSAYFSGDKWVWLGFVYRTKDGNLYDNYWAAVQASNILSVVESGGKIEITVYGGGGGRK